MGTITCSNLCTEIVEYTAPDEVAVCNLASIALPKFVDVKTKEFDFAQMHNIVKIATKNMNKVIDRNFYPVPEAEKSNKRHRPIGLGIQGLADAFVMLRYAFDSPEARQLNKDIFETLYHAALEASCEIAQVEGPYETYEGSPVSQGILQYDMWNVKPSNRWNWDLLKENIKKYGVRNSLLVAPMPTASTSQILGNNECFEPYTSNIYQRRVMSGEFQVVVSIMIMTNWLSVSLDRPQKRLVTHHRPSLSLEPSPVERPDSDGTLERIDEEPDYCCRWIHSGLG